MFNITYRNDCFPTMSIVQTYSVVSFDFKSSKQSTVVIKKISDGKIVIGQYKYQSSIKISVGSLYDFNKTGSVKKALQNTLEKISLSTCIDTDTYAIVIDKDGGLYGAINLEI